MFRFWKYDHRTITPTLMELTELVERHIKKVNVKPKISLQTAQSTTEESGGKGYQVGYWLNEMSCEGLLGHEN